MKTENQFMNNCEQIQLLIEDYLDGMISTGDKKRMEEHISSCNECKSYLEYTVMLIDNTQLMAREDKISGDKKSAIWNKIEAKITAKSLQDGDSRIYNMSGLEDEYVPPLSPTPLKSPKPELPAETGRGGQQDRVSLSKGKIGTWSSFKYYVSGLAAVFALAFIIYLVTQFKQGSEMKIVSNGTVEIGTKWKVTNVKGSPMIDNVMMKYVDSISLGQYIITDDSSRAELVAASLGTVTIEPNSRVKFVKSTAGEHRIELVYGSIDANIIAKPRSFFVDAGKVTAVDMGCSYKISMDEKGDGLLYVKSGRVSLEMAGGRESLVPEGKFCVLKKDFGPGTPFRGDTSPQLKKALMDFDFGECGSQCVNVILKNATKTDAVTLINIIPRVNDEYKTIVYNKVSTYCAAPKNLPKDSIPKCDKIEKLNEWVDKVMEEVHMNIEQNMKALEDNMKHFDNEKWGREWEKNFKDNWHFP
ncbi:MAG TPA: zf-HC2 domain-containing protein, partial [Ignavibacteria bacterium]|nr:zf-HC2 domain-containing protein [Ignavibacteria bacterium]